MNRNDDFYIGWNAAAPKSVARHTRRTAIALLLLFVIAAATLALGQKKFSTANFEFGQLTELQGIYRQFPVPAIELITPQDAFGQTSCLTIPLVGYGKSGAQGVIAALENEKNTRFNDKEIRLKGTLLYSDDKTLLQIDKNDNPLLALSPTDLAKAPRHTQHDIKELGTMIIQGEILDPKCYFGVMKPGSGKPHRDCAIRCIEGGISPVFRTVNACGRPDYYLILDSAGNTMNEVLKDFIADPVSLRARAVQYDDWVILYLDGQQSIHRLGGLSLVKENDQAISCSPAH